MVFGIGFWTGWSATTWEKVPPCPWSKWTLWKLKVVTSALFLFSRNNLESVWRYDNFRGSKRWSEPQNSQYIVKKKIIHSCWDDGGMIQLEPLLSNVIHTSNGYLAITQVPFRDRGTHLEKFRERIQSPLGTEMHWTCDALILSEWVELAYNLTIWKGTFPLCFVEVTFT